MTPGQGIPEMTLATLKRIERLLEKGVGFEPVLPPIVEDALKPNYTHDATTRSMEEDRGRYGYFSGAWRQDNRLTLRWYPGTEGFFPTFDQMAAAKSQWPGAEAWDFSTLAGDAHIFGIPLEF